MIVNILNSYVSFAVDVVSIAVLFICAMMFFRKKHIANILAGFSVLSLFLIELSKFFLFQKSLISMWGLGIGICLMPLFWLMLSVSFLPTKTHSFHRTVAAPLLGFFSLLFFLIWWINPFISIGFDISVVELSKMAGYFFVLLIFELAFALSNIERGAYYSKKKQRKILFISAIFLLMPYIVMATHAVWFFKINFWMLRFSSISILIGAVILTPLARKGFSIETVKETSTVNSSVTLLLIGGYLFSVGVFIKLFQKFGWNLNTVFSFFTAGFLIFILIGIFFSKSFKQRIKYGLLKKFTRQKYDWQEIWEDFTYKIALITDIEKISQAIKQAVSKIMDVSDVKVLIFEEAAPFEDDFCDWLLRKAESFNVGDIFDNGLSKKYPKAKEFLEKNAVQIAVPLYGNKKVVGLIGVTGKENNFVDLELLKVIALQASSVILNCRANQQLREAEKKESIYKVSSFVIHDVKNYINTLSLLIANKDKFHKKEFQQDALFTLESTIGKMKRLMDEFKALRGDLAIEKREHKICDIVEEALRDLSRERFKEINLTVDIKSSDEVLVDARYILKVVLNILINALEAMENKGDLFIEIGSTYSYGYVAIKDNGSGMSEEFMENRLFKPFSSTKNKGLGIGLYQSKTIVEAHDGKIEVDSEKDKGTTFTVYLPRVAQNVRRET